jgi:enoyl-CoA hydratase
VPEAAVDQQIRLAWAPGATRADLLLDRPDKLNALTVGNLERLAAAVRGLMWPDCPRVLVVRSTTPRAFSVGADINEWAAFSPLEAMAASERGTAALASLAELACPVVAAISGHCVGGGLELALACDLRVADRTARLGFPEATLGNATGWGGLPRLVALVGPGRAKDLLLTGRILEAEEALAMGLIDRLADADALSEAVDELVGRIAANGPVALRTIKRTIEDLAGPPSSATFAEALAAAVHAGTEDARRGKESFRSRTQVEFEGR